MDNSLSTLRQPETCGPIFYYVRGPQKVQWIGLSISKVLRIQTIATGDVGLELHRLAVIFDFSITLSIIDQSSKNAMKSGYAKGFMVWYLRCISFGTVRYLSVASRISQIAKIPTVHGRNLVNIRERLIDIRSLPLELSHLLGKSVVVGSTCGFEDFRVVLHKVKLALR